jgi:uncharacterized protein YciI
MLFAVRFEDNPDRLDVRRREMAAHLAYLDHYKDRILVGGSLRDADDEPIGGLWVVEAPDLAHVEALVHGDPFWTAGLRKTTHINRWAKAFPGRLVPV